VFPIVTRAAARAFEGQDAAFEIAQHFHKF
jgi:hypothetical protein